MEIVRTMRIANCLLLLIPLIMVLATALVVDHTLANGIVSGKYFWFYLSMGGFAVTSFFLISKSRIKFNLLDGVVLLYGISTLLISYFYNHSEAVTKHVLLILVIVLYFYLRLFLGKSPTPLTYYLIWVKL